MGIISRTLRDFMYENITQAMTGIYAWKKHKRNVVTPIEKHIAYRPTYNLDFYRESVFHRLIDLFESTYSLYNSGQFLGSMVLARSVQETLSVLNFVNTILEKLVKSKDLSKFIERTNRLILGYCGDDEFPEKINIMDCIDSVDKNLRLEGKFRQHYNLLSEYAHPNNAGTFSAYGQTNLEFIKVNVGPNKKSMLRMKKHIESTLMICITLLDTIQKGYEPVINGALEYCIECHENGELISQFYNEI
jgi:hypothetical protein